VARDGIEPPTPAFSGPPTDMAKWFKIQYSSLSQQQLRVPSFRITWDDLGCFWPFDVRLLFGRMLAWEDDRKLDCASVPCLTEHKSEERWQLRG
jgi:hypothetical protein